MKTGKPVSVDHMLVFIEISSWWTAVLMQAQESILADQTEHLKP